MTNDSHLFKPRPWWEARGYKADQYGRWTNIDGDIALPLYEGRMIGQFDFCEKGWVRGKGRSAVWRDIDWSEKSIEPQYLMSEDTFEEVEGANKDFKLGFMAIGSATNKRSMIASTIPGWPCGNSIAVLSLPSFVRTIALDAVLNSFVFDFWMRSKLGGLNLNYFVIEEAPLPNPSVFESFGLLGPQLITLQLNNPSILFSQYWMTFANDSEWIRDQYWQSLWALTKHERFRLWASIDAIIASIYGLDIDDLKWICRDEKTDPKGFWRIDDDDPIEIRRTSLVVEAFEQLQKVGLDTFAIDGMELTKDSAQKLGPRFLEWQKPDATKKEIKESWQECEQHARIILGEEGFKKFMQELESGNKESEKSESTSKKTDNGCQQDLLL